MFVAAFIAARNDGDTHSAGDVGTTVIEVGDGPIVVEATAERVYVSNAKSARVAAVDVASGEIAAESDPLQGRPVGLVVTGSDLWVGSTEAQHVYRLDAQTLDVRQQVALGPAPAALAPSADGIWVAVLNQGVVALISEKGEVEARLRGVEFPSAVASDESAAYVADVASDTVTVIDVARRRYGESIEVGRGPVAIDVAGDALWVALSLDESVARVDADGRTVTTIRVGSSPGDVVVTDDFVWVTLPEEDVVVRIDPETGDVVGEPVRVGDNPQGIDVAPDGSVWVANQDDDTITRLDP